MKIIMVFFVAMFVFQQEDLNSEKLLKQMYDRYAGKWYQSLTFVQRTESYAKDSLIKTATWYEALLYPNKFRIDFGDLHDGNAIIFNNDSAYLFKSGVMANARADANDLTFLLGGLYFYSFDRLISQVKALHYDLSRFHTDTWDQKPVYVIGANTSEEQVNQLWIDKDKLVVVRFIKFDDGRKEEGILDDYVKLGGGWSETKVTFFINGKLIQKEYYRDCNANVDLDPAIFQPGSFGKTHWYKQGNN
jgi:hypothetical protein